jgi:adenylylsulfate kinase
MVENKKRSIVKALSWRILATLTTISVIFIFTRDISLSLGAGFVEMIVKLIIYYGHERVWNMITWGRKKDL